RPFQESVKTGASYRLMTREQPDDAAPLLAFRQALLTLS
ncbi:MAG TPA: LysR family transcriptional regulator, partial [Franconibacter helveticus]|nr:LysR family transcriptional regulator [Franconibacter helveticus]